MEKEEYIQQLIKMFGYTYEQAEKMYHVLKDSAEHSKMNITLEEAAKTAMEGYIETEKLNKIIEYEMKVMRRNISKSK